jgi:hypothetical protein
MSDPSQYLVVKIASAIGGFFGGAGMMSFIKPRSISEAFMRGAMSTGSAIIFADPVLRVVGLEVDWEMQLMSGGIVGFVAYSLLGAVANFFKQNEKTDIVTLVNKAKGKRK